MDEKKATAHLFLALAKHYVDDPIHVHLLAGPGKGSRLAGCVGWAGAFWRVDIDRNMSTKALWWALWHELAHVYFEDAVKEVSEHDATDRALIRGVDSASTRARFQTFKAQDQERERQRHAWAEQQAERWRPALDGYLEGLSQFIE